MVSDPNRLREIMESMAAPDNKQFKAMLYSPFGTGKTTLGLQILDKIVPDDKIILHVDTSDNKDVIPDAGISHPVQPVRFTTIEDLRLVTEAMIEGQDPWSRVGGILMDEASTMVEEDLDRVYESRKAHIESGKIRMPADGVPLTPDWADYRPALTRFRSMLANLYDIPNMHIILIAHEDTKMNGTNLLEIRPNMPPKTLQALARPLHLLGRVSATVGQDFKGVAEYQRDIQIHPVKKVVAKSKIGISSVKFNAEELPDLVHQWYMRGAKVEEVEADVSAAASEAGLEDDLSDNPFE